jgi:hypothetical protein
MIPAIADGMNHRDTPSIEGSPGLVVATNRGSRTLKVVDAGAKKVIARVNSKSFGPAAIAGSKDARRVVRVSARS